jgi:hypothetical protein
VVLLLYCSTAFRCHGAASAGKRDDEAHGGLRSTVGPRSPRVPWTQPRTTAPPERRAVPKHDADGRGRLCTTVTRMPRAFVGSVEEFEMEPMVEANGNKPISPLSVFA